MKDRFLQTGKKIILLFCLLSCFVDYSVAQCGTDLGANDFPFTSGGLTTSFTKAGSVSTYPSSYTNCGVTTKAGNFYIGSGAAGSVTTNYSSPVTKLNLKITAANKGEVFTFTPNAGTVSLRVTTGCNYSINGNVLSFTDLSGVEVEVTGSTGFTSLTTSHDGGGGSGSLMTYCGNAAFVAVAGPQVMNVTGGGATCVDGAKEVGLANSEVGVKYQLTRDGANVGNEVIGTGNVLSLGAHAIAGTYKVNAIKDGVTKLMNGAAVISIVDAPSVSAVALNAEICRGASTTLTTSPKVVYLRSSTNEPWGGQANVQELDAVYGAGKWSLRFFETTAAASIFSSGTATIFMEGSDAGGNALKDFLNANRAMLENWVHQGGQLFLNAAPNIGSNIDFGFGGVTLNYPHYANSVSIAAGAAAHSIFTTPNATGTAWSGGSFGHAHLTGGSTTPLIQGDGKVVLAEKNWGSGKVLFGGMTLSQFHSPSPQASNLRKNILTYLKRQVPQVYTYKWSPAAGLSADNIESVIATPQSTTTYTLVVTNEEGCSTTSAVTVQVKEPLSITSQPNDTVIYSGKDAKFAVVATGDALTYQWQIKMGYAWSNLYGQTNSTLELAAVTSEMNGNQYRCVVSGSCPSVNSNPVTLTVLTVVPGFSVSSVEQCLKENNFSFTNTTTTGEEMVTYSWDFGDGSTSTETNPIHVYEVAGSYSVKMIAETEDGFKDSVVSVVQVFAQPEAKYSVSADALCLTGNMFTVINESSVAVGDLQYKWKMGDGSESEQKEASYAYTNAGTYGILLQVTTEKGCVDSVRSEVVVHPMPEADFSVNLSKQCLTDNKFVLTNTSSISSGMMSYTWNFGNGKTSTEVNPENVYTTAGTYSVELEAASKFGCISKLSQEIVVHPQPAGTIQAADGTDICEGSFTTLQVVGGASYQWYLNDQAISQANSASFKATEKGKYSVKLISDEGCETMASNEIAMEFRKTPVVDFEFDKYCQDVPVKFLNKSSVTESGPVSYSWSFGNTSTSEIKNPSTVYNQPGEFKVKLIVTPQICPELAREFERSIAVESPVMGTRYPLVDASLENRVTLKARELPASVEWIPATGLSDSRSKSPVLNPTKEQDFQVRYSFASGCTTTDSILVRIFPSDYIYVPKAFTPNGDGRNDVLRPLNVGIRQLNYFRVYNRWGNLLFETRKINDGWDGTFRGAKQSSDTYIWSAEGIDQNGKIVRRSGNTTLIR